MLSFIAIVFVLGLCGALLIVTNEIGGGLAVLGFALSVALLPTLA